jgi:hypothetical protein
LPFAAEIKVFITCFAYFKRLKWSIISTLAYP